MENLFYVSEDEDVDVSSEESDDIFADGIMNGFEESARGDFYAGDL